MVTALDDPAFAEAALEIGAYGYIIKPFKPNEVVINVANALRRRMLEIQSRNYREELERTVEERTKALRLALKNVQRSMEGVIHAMALTIETRDPYTAGHQARVTRLAVSIGQELNLSPKEIEGIRMAGMIHDVGKIAVPAEILSKPGDLTDIEFSLIKTHPTVGYHILKDIDFPYPIAQIVLQHHERLDGSGYPKGASGDQILIQAKIIAVADVVEAMASHRPYRPSLGVDKALWEIGENRGVLYDPEVAELCIRLIRDKGFSFK
ncbi:MAG: HD domain-containing protein [Deltaproteobacteria bacterium]|nr:HD domain-containing protein [Deltaproteobacteria bacterium]MBW2136557.1 HD domain-containing protein [Deltaproteobacteria bacterium]